MKGVGGNGKKKKRGSKTRNMARSEEGEEAEEKLAGHPQATATCKMMHI